MAVKQSALGSRPAGSFEKKLVGIVVATVGESKVKFTMVDEKKKFKGDKESMVFLKDDLPAVPALTDAHNGKQFRIRMNSDGDEVEALTPVVGHYTARLIDLGPRKEKDGDPTPYEREFTRGDQTTSHLEFFAVYKITKGMYKGVQMPGYYLHYKFEPDEEGNTRYAGNFDNKKATRLFQLKSWMEVHDLESEPIAWDDETILPVLLERSLDNDREVELIIKDGYIAEVLPVQEDEADEPKPAKKSQAELKREMDFDDVDEEFPAPKDEPKAAKKPAKKPASSDVDADL